MGQLTSVAQYTVNVHYSNPKDSTLYFRIATFDEKLFIPKDTIKLIKNKAKISSATSVFGGIYYIYLPNSGYKIQLCLENKDVVNLKIDGNLPFDSIQTTDPENKIFLKYQALENSFQHLDSQYAAMQKRGTATLRVKEELYRTKREQMTAYRKTSMTKLNTNGLLYKYFKILNQIDAFKPDKNDYAGRDAFIKQFNLKDQQLYFTPVIKSVLYEYLSAYPLVADSALNGIEVVMKKMDCKDKPYPNTFNYFSSILQNSTIKDNMKGYVKFVDKYLLKNSCQFIPKNRMDGFLSTYNRFKEIAVKDTITDIVLKDTSGKVQNLKENIAAYDYTIISFYDPTCEHCKYQMPELDSTLKTIRSQSSLKILNFAICNTPTSMEKEWKSFIKEKNFTEEYVHVILGEMDNVRNDYAAYSNPIFYLCDTKGNIVLKKASISSIKKFLLTGKN